MRRAFTAALWRPLSTALGVSVRSHGDLTGDRSKPLKTVWTLATGEVREVTAYDGQTLLDVAAEHQLPIEGACAGSCACSTCHLYLEDAAMEKFPDPSDEENDMLDLAFFPTSTSRLGCQLRLNQAKHDGLKVALPKATRNMAVDGYVAKPH